MLRTRLLVGSILAALAFGMLVVDEHLAPIYPFLLLTVLTLSLLGTRELLALLSADRRPPLVPSVAAAWGLTAVAALGGAAALAFAFAGLVLAAFLCEMWAFREPGGIVERLALTVFVSAYLGLLPAFLVMLRWLDSSDPSRGTTALALAIFVPKCCDIGAYFTGRLIGRHLMSPLLSPKKTWEGAVGGLLLATVAGVGIARMGPVLPGDAAAAGFGFTVGLVGMLGDLAESLIKRDLGAKDASRTVPGFGGVLDVVDSIVFAAPVAYVWLR